jgi:tRNA A37 threonylcarbamoyladenosine dehydratase
LEVDVDNHFFLRQLDIADPSQFKDKPVTVIGAGGIGAATVVALAKTDFENITVYDFDTVRSTTSLTNCCPYRWATKIP